MLLVAATWYLIVTNILMGWASTTWRIALLQGISRSFTAEQA